MHITVPSLQAGWLLETHPCGQGEATPAAACPTPSRSSTQSQLGPKSAKTAVYQRDRSETGALEFFQKEHNSLARISGTTGTHLSGVC